LRQEKALDLLPSVTSAHAALAGASVCLNGFSLLGVSGAPRLVILAMLFGILRAPSRGNDLLFREVAHVWFSGTSIFLGVRIPFPPTDISRSRTSLAANGFAVRFAAVSLKGAKHLSFSAFAALFHRLIFLGSPRRGYSQKTALTRGFGKQLAESACDLLSTFHFVVGGFLGGRLRHVTGCTSLSIDGYLIGNLRALFYNLGAEASDCELNNAFVRSLFHVL
jgi:hypothetical protein